MYIAYLEVEEGRADDCSEKVHRDMQFEPKKMLEEQWGKWKVKKHPFNAQFLQVDREKWKCDI